MKQIYLQNNKGVVLVDDESFSKLSRFKWYLSKSKYAMSDYSSGRLYMHRLVTHCPQNKQVDHINGNTLDNRKENLRICNPRENAWHRKKQKNNKSGYIGVIWRPETKKWRAWINLNGKHNTTLGYFTDPKEAALAYNEAAFKQRGEYAVLNEL